MDSIPEENKERMHKKRTVLVVEDEPHMLALLKNILLRHGYGVLTAADGAEALQVYRRNKLDIVAVLLDHGIPRVSGREAFLRMKEENPDVRAVIASGYLESTVQNEMSQAGVRHFVRKPYAVDEVLDVLRNLIESP